MKKSRIILTFIVLLTFIKIAKGQTGDTGRQIYTIDSAGYWLRVSPINLIDTLYKYKNGIFVVMSFPNQDWYNSNIIPILEQKVNDTSASGYVISGYDSYAFYNLQSTIGEQVQCLIQGINEKLYPPTYWLWRRRNE